MALRADLAGTELALRVPKQESCQSFQAKDISVLLIKS